MVNEGDVTVNEGDSVNQVFQDIQQNSYTIDAINKIFNYVTNNTSVSEVYAPVYNIDQSVRNVVQYTAEPSENFPELLGQLTDATVALGAGAIAITGLTAALPGIVTTALLGALGGYASGIGRGHAQGSDEVVVNVPAQAVSEEENQETPFYGGGNSPSTNCDQLLQHYIALGLDLSGIPEPCRSKLGLKE